MRALALSVCTMAEAAARHTGTGIARRAAFHERQRAERAELEAAGGTVLPEEKEGVALVDAATVLDGVDEYGPNYIRSRPKEKKKVLLMNILPRARHGDYKADSRGNNLVSTP